MPRTGDISLCAYRGSDATRVKPCVSRPADTLEDCDRRVFRPPPAGARRTRSGTQTARHVHRLDRLPRPHALPLGDHRQLRRRGARRARLAHRRRPARRRQRRGARQGARHPGRHRTAHRSVRRRGRLHEAARRRQVRRRLVRGIRRPPRRRRIRGERAVGAPRRRSRPRRQDLVDVVPPRRAGRVRQRVPVIHLHPVRQELGAAGHRTHREGRDRHPDPLLGRPADLHEGCRVQPRGACSSAPADGVPGAGPRARHPRRAPAQELRGNRRRDPGGDELPVRRRHLGVRRVPRARCADHRHLAPHRVGDLHRDGAGPAADRRDGAHRGGARVPGRHRPAVGDRVRDGVAFLRQHHRHAQGRHASAGLRAGPHEGAPLPRSNRMRAGSRSAPTSSRRTTSSPAWRRS